MEVIKLIVDRLLGIDAATRRRSIEAAALYVFTAIASCNLFTLSEQWQDLIIKVIILAVEAFVLFYEAHYKNNDHTEVAAEFTGEMRQMKAEVAASYDGERFYTDLPDIAIEGEFDNVLEEDEDLDEIEGEIGEVKEDE